MSQKRQEGVPVRLVTGLFDPLLAAHVRGIEEVSRPGTILFAALGEAPKPLLPAAARAELLAALRMIDYVVLPQAGGFPALEAQFAPHEVFPQAAVHEEIAAGLVRHVLDRHAVTQKQ